MTGAEAIAAERQRQIEREGFDEAHDDEHLDGEIAGAAAAYATVTHRQLATGNFHGAAVQPPAQTWRWSHDDWKPTDDPQRNLEIAGALCAAEWDRLERLKP